MNQTKKLVTAGLFIAISVIFNSLIVFPIGLAKVAPVQHFMNVLTAIWLGPWYAVACAFVTSVIRNMMGTGSVLAFPGSMIGALFAGLMYQRFRKISLGVCGEVVGTGILGAMIAALMALPFLGKEVALFGFLPSFFVSSLVGATVAAVLLKAFEKRGLLDKK